MYKSFFGLKESPFNVNPDPRYLLLTTPIEEALAGLMYGIQRRKGFITLTGEVGTGKTTLVNRLLDWLHLRRTKTAFLFNSRMNTNQLFDFVLAEFEIQCDVRSKSQQLMKLNQWLLDRYRSGETAVLIIDEAQNLTFPVLEEIRLLTNLEQLRQLRQRIMLRCKTSPLSREEIGRYIVERLRIGGAADPQSFFAETAIDAVHLFSMGIPRVINLLCEHSLINAYVEQQRPIQARIVEDVAREFQLDEVEPVAPANAPSQPDADVYNSEAFIQSLGEALARFRVGQPVGTSSRNRK